MKNKYRVRVKADVCFTVIADTEEEVNEKATEILDKYLDLMCGSDVEGLPEGRVYMEEEYWNDIEIVDVESTLTPDENSPSRS